MTSSAELIDLLVERNLRIAFAESLTGGMLAAGAVCSSSNRVTSGSIEVSRTVTRLMLPPNSHVIR